MSAKRGWKQRRVKQSHDGLSEPTWKTRRGEAERKGRNRRRTADTVALPLVVASVAVTGENAVQQKVGRVSTRREAAVTVTGAEEFDVLGAVKNRDGRLLVAAVLRDGRDGVADVVEVLALIVRRTKGKGEQGEGTKRSAA